MKTQVHVITGGELTPVERHWQELRRAIAPHPLLREVESYANAGRYRFRLNDVPLSAIFEAEHHDDGRYWAHLSLSAPGRLPSWKEVRWVPPSP